MTDAGRELITESEVLELLDTEIDSLRAVYEDHHPTLTALIAARDLIRRSQ